VAIRCYSAVCTGGVSLGLLDALQSSLDAGERLIDLLVLVW
jgi:hypothetical protein